MPETVALVGSDSLLGREVRDIVATGGAPIALRLIASEEEQPGTLTRVGDEPAVVSGLDAVSLAGVRAVLLAGSAESSRKALELGDAVIIDLAYSAEDDPDARLRAPMVESEIAEAEAVEPDGPAVHVIAHPAAIALALFLRRLHANDPIRHSVIQIYAPATEFGPAGVEELQQQTVSLLSFKSMPRAVFDSQLGFNMLARLGDEAPAPLQEIELRIEHHLASLLALEGDGAGVPMPSLRLVQAPVFHGYSFSAWVEFVSNPGIEALQSSLETPFIDVRGADLEPPTNVGQAGQSGISVGAIAVDRNQPNAVWFWIVADNLRLVAENAVLAVQQLL